jgi:putative glycosyltransferase (TIGR04372 family)
MISRLRLKLLERLIYRAFEEKLNWDFNQKPFSKRPLYNLLELLIALLSIFDLGRRERLEVLSSIKFYYIFFMPLSRLFCTSLNRFEKGLLAIFVKFDFGYVNFSNKYFVDYLKELFIELIHKPTNHSKADWKYIARLSFQLDKQGLLAIKALRSKYSLKSDSFSASEVWEATNACAGVFHMNGFIKSGEEIEIEGKKLSDQISLRSPGHYLENVYFSAIGHISLLDYLLKGKMLGEIAICKEQLIYNKSAISNQVFAQLFLPVCEALNIELLVDYLGDDVEGDLVTFVRPEMEYVTARRVCSDIQMKWEFSERKPLISLTDEMRTNGLKILKRIGLPEDVWFVGLHIRSTNDLLRIGRNANFENYIEAIEEIAQQGGWVLRTGSEKSNESSKLNNYIDTRTFNISKFEREILHTYIWSSSKFFIGNLSGGTHPPAAFGVPTLWADIHPISGFRPPSRLDLMIPKKIYNSRSGTNLSLQECLSAEHRDSQSENPLKLLSNGYKLSPSSPTDLRLAVCDMLTKLSLEKDFQSKPYYKNENARSKIVDTIYSKVGLGYGSGFCESFLDRNPSYLE